MESKALVFNNDYIDMYSASWGPPDNGKAMDGPKGITALVLDEAMKKVFLKNFNNKTPALI